MNLLPPRPSCHMQHLSGGDLRFPVHLDLAGKAADKQHRNVPRKRSGVITPISGLREVGVRISKGLS